MSEKIFNRFELNTILSMSIYWQEVFERDFKDEILLAEYRTLTNFVDPEKLLKSIAKVAEEELKNE